MASRVEMLDSGILVEHLWSTFDLAVFKIIWGHSVHLRFFRKYDCQKSCLFYIYDSFATKLFISVPCDCPHKLKLFLGI